MPRRLAATLAALLFLSAATRARQLTEERALADLYGETPRAAEGGTWRIGERAVTILLVAAFQEDGVAQQLFVTAASPDPSAASAIGAILYARRGTDWALSARRAELFSTAAGASRGSPRLVRLSPRRHGFMVQETKTSAGESSSFVTLGAQSHDTFTELLKVPTEYRGAGGGRVYRGCGPSSPPSLPCSRHARLSFAPGSSELYDAELAAQVSVGERHVHVLPTATTRYVYDGERYRPLESASQAAARALEAFFADWVESRAEGRTLRRFAADNAHLAPALRERWLGAVADTPPGPADGTPLGRADASRLGYIALGVHADGDGATADAVPIETAVRGGAGRIPVRLERRQGTWLVAELGESASR